MRASALTVLLTLVALGASADSRLPALEPLNVTVPVRFHVVHDEDGPIVDEDWLDEQIRRANLVFIPSGLLFEAVDTVPLPERHAELFSRADRSSLASHLEPRVVNVFIVSSMLDVDNETEWRRGVHWTVPSRGHFLVLTETGPPTTLAHELGHFFGVRRHRFTRGNIMGYRHGAFPRFDDDQLRRVVHGARGMFRSRRLLTVERLQRDRQLASRVN